MVNQIPHILQPAYSKQQTIVRLCKAATIQMQSQHQLTILNLMAKKSMNHIISKILNEYLLNKDQENWPNYVAGAQNGHQFHHQCKYSDGTL